MSTLRKRLWSQINKLVIKLKTILKRINQTEMKKALLILIALATSTFSFCQTPKQQFVSTDIDNFWAAYEKIISTTDSTLQYQYLRELYIDQGTEGLKALLDVRHYSDQEFIYAINNYPKFWSSIKLNTLKVQDHYASIEADIAKLRAAYPELKPSIIYFSIGAFRSNGTIQSNKVLIGSEMALSSKDVDVSELPEHPKEFNALHNPIDDLGILCTHEYVHTQQKELVHNLLTYCIYEGIAEFVSTLVTGKPSYLSAISFGENNYIKVRDKFEEDLYTSSRTYHWLWSTNKIFEERDLGYAVGYGMAKRYYNNATDKAVAIKEMIELDFSNENEVENFVDKSGYLSKPIQELYTQYEASRPYVIGIDQFKNGSQSVKPGLTKITVIFSEPLNGINTSIDFGPLGQDFIPQINPERTWSADNKSWTLEADLKPNKRYQILISNNFRKENGVALKPYLIDITTTK